MAEQRVEQHFIDGADFLYQAAAPLAKPLADAAHGIVASLAGGGKVMVLGQGASALDALRFAGFLLGGLERARPPLPALVIGAGVSSAEGAAADAARELQVLGAPGDVLVVFTARAVQAPVVAAIDAAHVAEMIVIAFHGESGERTARLLRETDVGIACKHDRLSRVHEIQTMAAHALCAAVDHLLLGAEEDSA
ncbi:MAG TPA: SIS domain-containing protein [Burkholderiaceae bacterium]|jgi:D-sedoheptulose 7-phosphate isomerase|nr:SIS domain-containing protein [Burkholderiaceae bacterium]